MKRYLEEAIKKDLGKKIILLSGPRQSGKTTLSRILDPDFDYLNFDYAEHRLIFNEKSRNRKKSLSFFKEVQEKRTRKAS